MIAPSVLINTFFVEVAVWPTKLFHDSLVTQRSAGNTVALSVAMLATKCVMTFDTRCHLVATAVPNGRLLLCRLCRLRGRGRAGSATNLPVPGHQSKGKTQALSSVSLPAPMQKRRKSQAQGPQVTQLPQSADSLEDPEPRRKAATENNAVRRLHQVSAVCVATAGQSAVRDGRWLRQSLRALL